MIGDDEGREEAGEAARTAAPPREGRPAYRIDFTACRVVRVALEPRRAEEPEPAVLP